MLTLTEARRSEASLRAQNDERLVELARSDHSGAFEAIAERYRGPLLRQAHRLLDDHGLAEDAVQQALLNAYRAMRLGEARPQLRPWLHRICHNSALKLLRARVQRGEPLLEDYAQPRRLNRFWSGVSDSAKS
jgi:DNA-directed RNA polymerase specialized sigma24 family protein